MSNISFYPGYETELFCDIYSTVDEFIADYNDIAIPNIISNTSATTLYYLLYGKYGNTPIANYDVNQFKYKLFSLVFEYGPTWEKKLDIQAKLRALSEDDLLKGSKAVFNHALNPSTDPSTDTDTELEYINEQSVTKNKKTKMDAYLQLWNMLSDDITSEFIAKFQICFKKFVKPGTYLYKTEEDEV